MKNLTIKNLTIVLITLFFFSILFTVSANSLDLLKLKKNPLDLLKKKKTDNGEAKFDIIRIYLFKQIKCYLLAKRRKAHVAIYL